MARRKTFLVVAFNARPIALSAKRLGLHVLAADYWGDADIQGSVDGLVSVIKQRPGNRPKRPDAPVHESLFDAALKAIDQYGAPDSILMGSGMDDHPDFWERLERVAPILGNDIMSLLRMRNRIRLFALAEKIGIVCPDTIEVKSADECLEVANEMGYPVILKPLTGSGGYGIDIAHDEDEARRFYGNRKSLLVQEYVKGIDASSSVLGNGDECMVVSVNEQLIGKKELGSTRPFGYCGNIVPLGGSPRVRALIEEASRALGEALGIVGTNGIDWVVRSDDVPVLMEVNPRFQGTLECIEMLTGANVVKMHIEACKGRLPLKSPRMNGFATKMIVYAKARRVVGDLRQIDGTYDVPVLNTIIDIGDPICTVQEQDKTRSESIERAMETIKKVRNLLSSQP